MAEAAAAAGRRPAEVERAALGRAGDGAVVVVAQLAEGAVLVAAQRSGPVPSDAATRLDDGWQLRLTTDDLDRAWADAEWLRTGHAPTH